MRQGRFSCTRILKMLSSLLANSLATDPEKEIALTAMQCLPLRHHIDPWELRINRQLPVFLKLGEYGKLASSMRAIYEQSRTALKNLPNGERNIFTSENQWWLWALFWGYPRKLGWDKLFQLLGTTTCIPRVVSCLAVLTLCYKASRKRSGIVQLARKLKPQPLRHSCNPWMRRSGSELFNWMIHWNPFTIRFYTGYGWVAPNAESPLSAAVDISW